MSKTMAEQRAELAKLAGTPQPEPKNPEWVSGFFVVEGGRVVPLISTRRSPIYTGCTVVAGPFKTAEAADRAMERLFANGSTKPLHVVER